MFKKIQNTLLIILSLILITLWLYNGLYQKTKKEKINKENTDYSNILFQLLEKDTSFIMESIPNISYNTDTNNYINILRNQQKHSINIGEIAPNTTSDFVSITYNINTLNNYKKYLKNRNKLQNWDSINNYLKNNYSFNVNELIKYTKEVGKFTSNKNTFYYINSLTLV